MSVVFTDAFTGTSGTNLDTYDANWTRHAASSGSTVAKISNANRLRPGSSNADALYYRPAVTGSAADYDVYVDIVMQDTFDGFAGVLGRWSPSTAVGYFAFYDNGGFSGNGVLRLYRYGGTGGTASLGTYNCGTLSGTHTIKLSMSGTSLIVYLDGTSRISVTDASNSLTGRAGVRVGSGFIGGTDSSSVHLDNFNIDDPITLKSASESVSVTDSSSVADLVTSITGSDTATVTDTAGLLSSITPTAAAISVRTTGSPTVIETKSGDTMGGVAQNHNAFPGMATLPNGNVLIAYQKGYTHGGGNCVVEWAILAPDGSTVTAPSVLRYASGTQNNNVYPALPGWNSADVSCVYIPRSREVMCLWNEVSYTSAWGYPPATLQRMAAWYDTVTGTWSSPADVGMGFSNSPSLYAIAPTPPIVDGNGDLLAAVYHDLSTAVSCVKSTDNGRSWTVVGTIASSGVCDETALIRLDNGTLRAVIRSDVPYKLRICSSTGSHDGSTWGSVTDLVATPAGSGGTFYGITGRPSLTQDATGRVYLGARAMVGSAGDDNTYDVIFTSDDRLATLSAPIDPYTGSTATVGRTNQTTRGYCVYGALALLQDGNVGYLWAEEFFDHAANIQPATAQLLYRVLTTVTPGRATETATVTDAASVTVGVGAIVKTASEGVTVTDTASGPAVTRYVTPTDTVTVTDSGGGTSTVPNVALIATPTSLSSPQFSNSTLASDQAGASILVPADAHTVSTTV